MRRDLLHLTARTHWQLLEMFKGKTCGIFHNLWFVYEFTQSMLGLSERYVL